MSMRTWEKEFFPSWAYKRKSAIELIAASLKKWIGLQPKNLKRHGLKRGMCPEGYSQSLRRLYRIDWIMEEGGEGKIFEVDSETCHLCLKYMTSSNGQDHSECRHCPIYHYQDGRRSNPTCWPEYHTWLKSGNPEPMIQLLQKVLAISK